MTFEHFLSVVILGIAGAYILNALLLEKRTSHEGPFKDFKRTVVFPQDEWMDGDTKVVEPEHVQSVALWDWFRRIDGVYIVSGNTWLVDKWRAERWTCPYCLSFWTTIPLSLLFCLFSGLWFWLPAVHLAIAVISVFFRRIAYEN